MPSRSKKNASAVSAVPGSDRSSDSPRDPKPIEIPNPKNAPAVVAARGRYDKLNAKLLATRTERKNLEKRDIGFRDGHSRSALVRLSSAHPAVGSCFNSTPRLRKPL